MNYPSRKLLLQHCTVPRILIYHHNSASTTTLTSGNGGDDNDNATATAAARVILEATNQLLDQNLISD